MHPSPRDPLAFSIVNRAAFVVVKKLALVDAGPRAHQISIVRGRADANSLGGAPVHVAHVMGETLQLVGGLGAEIGAEDLVQEDGVVRWAGSAFFFFTLLVSV